LTETANKKNIRLHFGSSLEAIMLENIKLVFFTTRHIPLAIVLVFFCTGLC